MLKKITTYLPELLKKWYFTYNLIVPLSQITPKVLHRYDLQKKHNCGDHILELGVEICASLSLNAGII